MKLTAKIDKDDSYIILTPPKEATHVNRYAALCECYCWYKQGENGWEIYKDGEWKPYMEGFYANKKQKPNNSPMRPAQKIQEEMEVKLGISDIQDDMVYAVNYR